MVIVFPGGADQTWAETHSSVLWRKQNPDVSAYTSSPESKFSVDQFVYKIKLWEFKVQSKIAAEPSKAVNFLNRFVSTCYLFQS